MLHSFTLETERLLLRPLLVEDAGTIDQLLNDRELASNTESIDFPYPAGDASQWIDRNRDRWKVGDAYVLAICPKNGGGLMGTVELNANKRHHRAELSYWIGRRFWNQGFATEAAHRAVNFGFAKLGFERITSQHFSRNPASGRVLEKIGMTLEGTRKRHIRKWDQFEDVKIYGILAHDFRDKPPRD
jgi:ribosomal-protein-alanine N-acetyltransferase